MHLLCIFTVFTIIRNRKQGRWPVSTREKRVFHEGLNDLVFWYLQYVFTIHAQLILDPDPDAYTYDACVYLRSAV